MLAPNEHAHLVTHTRSLDCGCDDVKFIGVFSSRESAAAAVAQLVRQPGFIEHPDGFFVEVYPVDRPHWTEGFATVAVDGRSDDT
jgi:homoserine kinase type II